MLTYYLTDKVIDVPFNVIPVYADELYLKKIHFKLASTPSLCVVDMDANMKVACLPISTEVCKLVPKFTGKITTNENLMKLLRMFPQYGPDLRRHFMYGDEDFEEYINGLDKLNSWSDILNHLEGL